MSAQESRNPQHSDSQKPGPEQKPGNQPNQPVQQKQQVPSGQPKAPQSEQEKHDREQKKRPLGFCEFRPVKWKFCFSGGRVVEDDMALGKWTGGGEAASIRCTTA